MLYFFRTGKLVQIGGRMNTKIRIKIKEHRRAKGLTQQQLATRIGVTKACLSRWENWSNGNPVPTLRTLSRIAHALDIHVKDLFDE